MREIDQALARAYGTTPNRAASSPMHRPHFTVEVPDPRPHGGVVLDWPETVLALERQHADRFSEMARGLLEARDRRNVRVVLVTSGHRAEGRTTLVLCLARALARNPGRTLLLDADLTGPMLAQSLGLKPLVGLGDLIERDQATAEALIHAPDDHLMLLPLRAAVQRPREFFGTSAWSCLMNRFRREFDFVLIDGGPMFSGLSSAVVPQSVDAAVLVCHKAISNDRSVQRARKALESAGVPLMGIAETFC